jgi:hypothetical protein
MAVAMSSRQGDDDSGACLKDTANFRDRLQQGPLSHSERVLLWPRHLGDSGRSQAVADAIDAVKAPPALVEVLSQPPTGDDEEVLFESQPSTGADEEGGTEASIDQKEVQSLATAFSQKHLSWLASSAGQPQHQERLRFGAVGQLLMYHFPRVACTLRSVADTDENIEDVPAMLISVCNICGMAEGLAEALFEVVSTDDSCLSAAEASSDRTSLLLLCDWIVLEGQSLLLLFVLLVLLSEIPAKPRHSFAELEDELRQAVTLGSLARSSRTEVSKCVAHASQLLQATPLSLREAIQGQNFGAWCESPVCMVAPHEVLQHTHEGSSQSWRLIVVDARMRYREFELPVCIRLEPTRHSHRLQVLKDMPDDDVLHLCLVGDGPPRRSDEAFELCLNLIGRNSWRRHVSIIDGGWPALQERASSLGLDMMPVEVNTDDGMDAEAVVAEVAEQVALAAEDLSEKASAAAQIALSGASRALVYLDGRWGGGSTEEQAQQPAAVEAATADQPDSSAWSHASRAMGYLDSLLGAEEEQTTPAVQQSSTSSNKAPQEDPAAMRKPRIDQSAWGAATRSLDYLEGLWNSGGTEEQSSLEAKPRTDAATSHEGGPHFKGAG